ncbi:50S ribosomal protein L13 [Candidatus Wolfebacteria bacterium]|nr:50S ribosomal protein L13 [Candidatus Wolfebacteria bacterium]
MANYTIDATNKKFGRMASEIALILQGKKNPDYQPRLEGEDTVIVENIDKIFIDSKKAEQKIYYSHTTQIGHLKKIRMDEMLEKKGPAEVLRRAVMGMLPKNRLKSKRMKRLIIK